MIMSVRAVLYQIRMDEKERERKISFEEWGNDEICEQYALVS